MTSNISSAGELSSFFDARMTLLKKDLNKNTNIADEIFAKLRNVEDQSLHDVLEQLKTRETILTRQISELSEEKLRLRQGITKESTLLISSQRLILLTVVFSAAILAASAFYMVGLVQDKTNEIMEQKTERLNMASTQMENILLKLRSTIEASAELLPVQAVSYANLIDKNLHGIPYDADPEKRETANDLLRTNTGILAVFFALPNGDMYLSQPYHGQENMRDSNFAFRDWYKGVTKTHQTYTSELYSSQITNTKAMAIVTPVYSDSKYVGIWGMILNVDYLTSSLHSYVAEKKEQLLIVDKNQNIIYDSSDADLTDQKIVKLDYVNLPSGTRAEQLTSDVQTIHNTRQLVLTSPIHTTNEPLMAVLIQPYDDAFSATKILTGPMAITIIFVIIVLLTSATIIFNTIKKSRRIQDNIRQLGEYDQRLAQQAKPTKQEVKKLAIDKKVYALIIIALSLVAFNTYYSLTSEHSQHTLQMKTGFVIENLRGDTVDTWTAWNILPERTLNVRFVNPDDISAAQLDAIKEVILSEKSISVDDSITHKGPKGQESIYYEGWVGALKKVSEQQTKFVIPTSFHITDSSQGEGDIVFHFSKARSVDGYTGYTNAVVDQNQILKSTITIYDVDSLTTDQIGTIARHEFGHALGIAHSSAPEDLMAPTIISPVPYISDCDMSAIHSLYDGNENSQVTCEK